MCERVSRRPKPIFASHCVLVCFFFLLFNLMLTFYSVNTTLGRRNKIFRFSLVRDIPRNVHISASIIFHFIEWILKVNL